ncbi:5'-nucleotidase, cytosolic IIIB [Homo sapiens]|uniref:5'-nucleotidase, cytosolic IIIB n=1 Tax=Homo sapiens TaxID=9606 RepID=C9IZA4_HUMAN|nr:5'-nucleotidase, cytosolic IIIB [Homo sapiens]KAI4049484.1 5'-nucleotidase, cytosolic IIIB [Homo sapiens]
MAEEVRREEASGVGRARTPTPGALRAPQLVTEAPPLHPGEHPDEGHGPDAAAWAGAGDRGRPPQGRRRPVTGDF